MKTPTSLPQRIRQTFTVITLALLVGVISASADWSAPSATFPTCPVADPACNTPINVGVQFQEKRGPFRVQGLFETLAGTTLATLSGKVGIGTNTVDSRADVRLHVAKQGGGDAIITGVLTPVNDNDAVNKKAMEDYVDAQVGGGGARYLGATPPHNGDMDGILGANKLCKTAFPAVSSAHMCSYEEVVKSGAVPSVQFGWIDDAIVYGYFQGSSVSNHQTFQKCAHDPDMGGYVGGNGGNFFSSGTGCVDRYQGSTWTSAGNSGGSYVGNVGCAFRSEPTVSGEVSMLCEDAYPVLCCG